MISGNRITCLKPFRLFSASCRSPISSCSLSHTRRKITKLKKLLKFGFFRLTEHPVFPVFVVQNTFIDKNHKHTIYFELTCCAWAFFVNSFTSQQKGNKHERIFTFFFTVSHLCLTEYRLQGLKTRTRTSIRFVISALLLLPMLLGMCGAQLKGQLTHHYTFTPI